MANCMEEEVVSILVSPDEYPYHKNQIVSIGVDSIRVVRKERSLSSSYVIQKIPVTNCVRVHYKQGLVPLRVFAGVLLTLLMAGIFYCLALYWFRLDPGTSIKGELLGLAAAYGLKWTFMSRRHEFFLHMNDGSTLTWRSRSGDFKYKKRAVMNIIQHFRSTSVLVDAPFEGVSCPP